jgi:hypothetical protein
MAPDTSDYSPTKAPDTAEHAEERDSVVDPRLIPGGAEPRTDTPQGMEGLDRQQLPGVAADDEAATDHAGD